MSTQIAGETKIRKLKDRKEILKAAGDDVGVRECNRKIRLLKEKYNEITLKAGLDAHYDRISVARSTNLSYASHKKSKLTESVFDTYNFSKTDSIRPRSVIKELKTSKIGTDTLDYLEKEKVPVHLCYGVDNPEGYYGIYDPFDDTITIYCDKTKTIFETATTVIHEATHRKLGHNGTFAEEVECFKAEYLHTKNNLTEKDIEDIIELVKKLYPDLV